MHACLKKGRSAKKYGIQHGLGDKGENHFRLNVSKVLENILRSNIYLSMLTGFQPYTM
jgi:hypothetical protein